MLILPVDSTADRRFQILLGDQLLTLRTYFNALVPAWYLDLELSDGSSLIRGLAMVPGVNLLEAESELTRVYGQFRIIPLDGGENNTPTSLGGTAQLWWFEPGEWEALDSEVVTDVSMPFDVRAMFTLTPPADTNPPLDDLARQAAALDTITTGLYRVVNTLFHIRIT